MKGRARTVSQQEAGRPLGEVVSHRLGLAFSSARTLIRRGRVRLDGAVCRDFRRRVRLGQKLQARDFPDQPTERGQTRIKILYADNEIVVVDKPAGLTTVRHRAE